MSPTRDPGDPKRDLRLVGEFESAGAGEEAPAPAGEAVPVQMPEPTPAASTSYLSWVLLGATLLFAWLWLTQVDKANGLADDLVGVQGELASAQADIVAWEEHGASVQSGVEGIASQLGALQELLLAAPTSGTAFAPEPNSEAGIEQDAAPAE